MKFSDPVYILDARRSPAGRFGGALKSLSPADLALQVAEAVAVPEVRPIIDQIVLGQVLQAGAGMNVARQLGLRLGVPPDSPAFTVNMVCASGLKAVALAASAIAEGEASVALAGGVESMSRVPFYAPDLRWGKKLQDSTLADGILTDGLSDPLLKVSMGETAERIADVYRLSRHAQDEFALSSQRRALINRDAFRREIVPIHTPDGTIDSDESPRPDTTAEKLAKLKPSFRPNGTVTAGNSSGINDGAALLLLAGTRAAIPQNLTVRARIVGVSAIGCDPAMMGLGPVHAIRRVCGETGWKPEEVDAFEINEAFAAQTLACIQELNLDPDKVNQRGGAIALGHPIGCSGARVLVTLLHLLEDRRLSRGIAAVCVGGGMGMAMAIETVSRSG